MNLPLPPGFRLHRGLDAIPAGLTGSAVAIGNFDGVHLGHKAVLAAARGASERSAVALTFEPHPRSFFRPEEPVSRLTPAREKRLLLAREALDGGVELAFDAALAAMSAEDFVRIVLVEALDASSVVVGWDFHFGKGREGSPHFQREAGARHGFETLVVEAIGEDGPVSSSTIRGLLMAGRMREANRLLGHRWFIIGEAIEGEKRGRELGYPTANILLPPGVPLAHGIYAVRAAMDGHVHDAVASFGVRPTFHEQAAPLLEVYVFDMKRDLYGKALAVEFVDFIRGEQRFDSAESLISQMHRDAVAARKLLSRPVDPAAPSAIG